MSKAVLLSIKPEYCHLIESGKKTIEIRKSRPKTLKPPFKCYIYECKGKCGKEIAWRTWEYEGSGKIIGEFICDSIETVYQCHSGYVFEYGCINKQKFFDYLGIPNNTHFGYDKCAFAWHISNLIIYDNLNLKDLRDFYKGGMLSYDDWLYGIYNGKGGAKSSYESYKQFFIVKNPPQSWCYVEEAADAG